MSLVSITLYSFGVGAMYADDYLVAALLYFAGTAYLTAKILAWEDVTRHGARKGISLLVLLVAIVVFGLSLEWIKHRSNQVEAAKKDEPTPLISVWRPITPKPPVLAFDKTPVHYVRSPSAKTPSKLKRTALQLADDMLDYLQKADLHKPQSNLHNVLPDESVQQSQVRNDAVESML